jgi:hypothetical protein
MQLLSRIFLLWSIIVEIFTCAKWIAPEHGLLSERQAGWLLPQPSLDIWRIPPLGWEKRLPGDILRLRYPAYPNLSEIKHCIDTFQIQYRSTDTHGNPMWGVATVFIPARHANCSSTNPEGCAHAVVSYQFPYNTVNAEASPSYFLQFGDLFRELEDLLEQGWFVVVPDYEGPTADYCANPQAAYLTLDAGKAVMKVVGSFGLRMDKAKYLIWGYSAGAMSAAFAAEMAADYAPDLNITAIAYGGPIPNITTAGEMLRGQDAVGLVVACLVGITHHYPEALQFLIERIKKEGPYNATGFFNVTRLTGIDVLENYIYQDVFEYFVNGASDYYDPILQRIMDREGAMGYRGTPKMPLFVYKSAIDEMSPTEQMDKLYDHYCASGANILYHRNMLANHTEESFVSRPRVFQYLRTILNGENKIDVPKTGCKTVNVSVPFTGWEVPPIQID